MSQDLHLGLETTISLEDAKLLAEAKKKRANELKKKLVREENRKKQEYLAKNPLPLPDGIYRTIVIDPPWEMEKIKREVRPNQDGFDYPTMSVESIAEINLPLAQDAFVFLWTTQKYLPYSFEIFSAWRLKYRFIMTWHKSGGMQVYNYPQFNSEFVVVGTQGNPKFLETKAFKTTFNADRQGHSVKPEEFYELVRRITPDPRLDMFSRREIEGFDVWGNEVC